MYPGHGPHSQSSAWSIYILQLESREKGTQARETEHALGLVNAVAPPGLAPAALQRHLPIPCPPPVTSQSCWSLCLQHPSNSPPPVSLLLRIIPRSQVMMLPDAQEQFCFEALMWKGSPYHQLREEGLRV